MSLDNYPPGCTPADVDAHIGMDEIEPSADQYEQAERELATNGELLAEELANCDGLPHYALWLFANNTAFRTEVKQRNANHVHMRAVALAEQEAEMAEEYRLTAEAESAVGADW